MPRKSIPAELIPLAYNISRRVLLEELTFTEGKSELVGNNQMNPSSAADYINGFRCMMEGKRFTRTLNKNSLKFFLEHILIDYGYSKLELALQALLEHIHYYEGYNKTNMRYAREIHASFMRRLTLSSDELEQQEILKKLEDSSDSLEQIRNELRSVTPDSAETVVFKGQGYKRNNKTVAQLKILREFKCQICSTSILKKDGTRYVEAAHIDAKSDKGPETPENLIILCPNHHKEFDFGNRKVLKRSSSEIKFSLNGKTYTIDLSI